MFINAETKKISRSTKNVQIYMTNYSKDDFMDEITSLSKRLLTDVSLHPTASHLDNICTKFINGFSFIVNTHAPLKQMSKTKSNQKFKPWLTKGILKSIKNKLYANCYKQNNSNLISKYKQYSHKLTTIKKLAKEQYYTSQLLEHKSNISKQWAVINDLLGKTTNQNNAIHKMLKHDKQITKNKDEISNVLNDYFVNIGPNLSAKINNQSMSSTSNISCSVYSFIFLPMCPWKFIGKSII